MPDPPQDDWAGVPVFGIREEGRPWVVRPSAYGVIGDPEGRIAVVASVDGVFLPGGGIEPGESSVEALRREALEECGFRVRPGTWTLRAVQFAHSASEKSYFEKRSTFIECTIEGRDGSLLLPGHEVLWLTPRSALDHLKHPSHGWAVRQWTARETDP